MEDSLRDKFIYCLTQQVTEFETLKSIFHSREEIILTDNLVLQNINYFLDNKVEFTPNHLDFTLNLRVNNFKLEVCIDLPSFYPEEEPDIYIRCNQLNRHQETEVNTELTKYIKDNHVVGEVCLYTAISWLQDNIEEFENIQEQKVPVLKSEEQKEENFVRLWIYSHHIYNKKKREEIVKKAKDLNVTGFCLPGKPGIICAEGFESDCMQWWREVKSMTWKKIVIRKTEKFNISVKLNEQKFEKFVEIPFVNQTSRNSKHADMSGFSKFMDDNGLSDTFNDFFGLCKKLDLNESP